MAETLEKLAFTGHWRTARSRADRYVKRDMATRMNANKEDKSKLKDIADNVKEWKRLYSSLGGLTLTLKALENAKTKAAQSELCKAGVKVIDSHHRLLMTFNNGNLRRNKHIMDKGTTIILHDMLKRIKAELKKGIQA